MGGFRHIVDIALSPQTDTSDGLPGWVTVATPDQAFNLLDLQNGSTALLGEAVVPPGPYRAVRVTFDPARSGITDTGGDRIVTTATPGTPGIDWQSKEERRPAPAASPASSPAPTTARRSRSLR